MEFCPGGDLYAAIKKGGMSPSEVECCFKQILNGVAYLHTQGVAHRDIKPENLFFDAKGQLKVGNSFAPFCRHSHFCRSVITVLRPSTVYHGSRRYICLLVFVEASRILRRSSLTGNVSKLPQCPLSHPHSIFDCYLKHTMPVLLTYGRAASSITACTSKSCHGALHRPPTRYTRHTQVRAHRRRLHIPRALRRSTISPRALADR